MLSTQDIRREGGGIDVDRVGYVALFLLVDYYQAASLILQIIITSNKIEDVAQTGR